MASTELLPKDDRESQQKRKDHSAKKEHQLRDSDTYPTSSRRSERVGDHRHNADDHRSQEQADSE